MRETLQRIRIAPAAEVELRRDDSAQADIREVDCRLLFLGTNIERVRQAYTDAVCMFRHDGDTDRLRQRLSASAEIRAGYDCREEDGKTRLVMRDSFFREPGSLDGLEFSLHLSCAGRNRSYPVVLARFAALGNLMPLLVGRHTEDEVREALAGNLAAGDAKWAGELLDSMKSDGFVETGRFADRCAFSSGARPRVTLLAHTSLLMQSERSAVITDPMLSKLLGSPGAAFEVFRTRIGAICCTHGHWDHCNFQTLLWFDKRIPILIPRVRQPTAFNPPMAEPLRRLGFTDVREVELWTPILIDDIEVVPVPFHGEQDEPGAEIDHYTYVLRTKGLSVYGGVDSFRDSAGEMTPVLERVARLYHPEVAFLPVSKMVYRYEWGGVNGFCRELDPGLLDKWFQYTAGPDDAARWAAALGAGSVAPYALFIFSRWAAPPEIPSFASALKARGILDALYPLRPLDSLTARDLSRALRSRARRRMLLAWFRAAASMKRVVRLTGAARAYRLLRRLGFGALRSQSSDGA
jgi:L-ascorbate metabolism protein UlaG (beta-lactamase superfamily)